MINNENQFANTNNTNNTNNSEQGNIISNSILFNKIASSNQKISRCQLSGKNAPILDYKNIELLQKFISEKGRILPSRLTGTCRKKQRELNDCVKKARMLALLPFASSQ